MARALDPGEPVAVMVNGRMVLIDQEAAARWEADRNAAWAEMKALVNGPDIIERKQMDAIYARMWASPPVDP